MDEIKPVAHVYNIVTTLRGDTDFLIENLVNTLKTGDFLYHQDDCEALQKENGLLKLALVSKCDLLKSCEAALDQSHAINVTQAKRIAELEDAVNREAILKTLVLFQTECEILADTFRNGNMASKAIGKIDLVKFMDKWDKLISEVK